MPSDEQLLLAQLRQIIAHPPTMTILDDVTWVRINEDEEERTVTAMPTTTQVPYKGRLVGRRAYRALTGDERGWLDEWSRTHFPHKPAACLPNTSALTP